MPYNPNKVTEKLFQAPSKYIQGPSAFRNAEKYLSPLGKAPLLTCDAVVQSIVGKQLIEILQEGGLTVTYAQFNGEVSTSEINRIQNVARDNASDFIIGVGGGKTLDLAKAIAEALHLPLANLPTIAATDAPCSAVAVIYTPEGHFDHYKFLKKNPDIVLLDTSVIVQAPARFLAAGIGDAIATNVEAKTCKQSINPGGGLPTEVSSAIGEKCEETLFRYGKLAYEANKAKAVTPAFEAVVEANTLLSGLGFESGGVAAAHSIHNGLTAIEALHSLLHGEKVAFGVICQLVLTNAPSAETDKYISFLLSVDLPVTFEQLGVPNITDEELRLVAELATAPGETIYMMNISDNISKEKVFHAIKGADAAGREYIRRTGWHKEKE